jgi:subtilisin family serine protease
LLVDCPIDVDAESLAGALGKWAGVVEFAYAAGAPSDPQVVGKSNPLFAGQHHLNAAPEGIGVQAAWDRGLDGEGVMFVDLEQGWFLEHEDLPPGIALIDGSNRRESFGHGTAVLSTVIGLDNDRGGVGIAPAANVRITSYRREEGKSVEMQGFNIAGAITNAVAQMPEGSILLLEVQLRGAVNGTDVVLPAETQPVVFEAIRLATALGIIVIEAAGNDGVILDDFVDRNGRHVLSREAGPEFADSGAIVVAGCEPETPHRPDTDLNSGSRVDCHAWGSSVLTAGGPFHSEQSNAYFFFSGTSSSSAIIAGVAILVQQMLTEALGRPLKPKQMRRILGDPVNGTASTGGAADRIGVMPDLAAIIANELI